MGVVVRYTKDEILALRKGSTMPSGMASIPDVVSNETLDPVVDEPFSQDDVSKLWNAALKSDGHRAKVCQVFMNECT